MIEPAQRRYGLSAESILAVVVIFDDPGVMAFGNREEPQPVVHAHDRPERPLAGRCYVDHSRGRQTGIVELPPSLVHAQGRELGAATQHGAACTQIPRLLQPNRFAVVEKKACREIQCRLRARDDDDLVGEAIHSARNRQVFRDGLAQPPMSGKGFVGEDVLAAAPCVARQKPRPRRKWKRCAFRKSGMEIELARTARRLGPTCHQFAAARQTGRIGERRRLYGPDRRPQQRCHARTGTRLGLDVAFRQQLVIGGNNGVSTHTQLLRQRPCRRKAGTGPNPALENVRAQNLVELAVQPNLQATIDRHDVEWKMRVSAQRTRLQDCSAGSYGASTSGTRETRNGSTRVQFPLTSFSNFASTFARASALLNFSMSYPGGMAALGASGCILAFLFDCISYFCISRDTF